MPSALVSPSDPIITSTPRTYDVRFRSASSNSQLPPQNTTSSPSPFRPPVKAQDRLSSWTSPFAISSRSLSRSKLPTPLLDKVDSMVMDGLAPNTRVSYAAGLLRFNQFCDDWQIPELDRMPASSDLLAAFASSYVGSYSGKTVSSWLSGLRCWHIINNAPWHGESERLQFIHRAANRRGTKFKRPSCPPVSLDHLKSLLSALDLNIPFHAAVWATATTSFFSCRRLGEMTVPSPLGFDPSLHCSRSSDFKLSSLQNGTISISFRIPWTKTTRSEAFLVVLTARDDSLCPVAAIINHFRVNTAPPANTSLFAYKLSDGGWSQMIKRDFLSFILRIWGKQGNNRISGHCFRIGGAVALLLSGVPPEVVAATGGWTSLAFLLYWRRVEEIIPLCTSFAYSRTQIDQVSSIMHSFSNSSCTPSS